MKQINIFLLVFLMSIISLNAVSFTFDDTIQSEFKTSDLSFQNSYTIFGNDNTQYTVNNKTFTYDFRQFVDTLNDNYYIVYENNVNFTDDLQILITTIIPNEPTITTAYNVSFVDGVGIYYFRLSPDRLKENFRLEINAPNGYSGILRLGLVNTEFVKNANSITATFVGAMKTFIDINIGIWRLIYYLFIIALIFMGIGILIAFSFKVYDWAENLGDKKRDIIERTQFKNNKRRD